MIRSTILARVVALLFVAYLAVAQVPDAAACSSYSETVEVTSQHPDLPLEPFVAGHLGLLQSTYPRRYLVVAYRWLAASGLTPREQAEVLHELERRTRGTTQAELPTVVDGLAKWREVRARLPNAPASVATGAYDTATYTYVDWCLPDAFLRATTTLEGKLAAGRDARAAEVWATAQDQVFAQCRAAPGQPLPAPLAATAPPAARRERDYQIASALFYARRFDEARIAFETYGRGAPADEAALAKYLVARTQQRAGDLVGAERTLRALLADPTLRARHAAATRYLGFLRARSAPAAVCTELEQKLAAPGEINALGEALADHSMLLDLTRANPASTPGMPRTDGERLRAWLELMQQPPLAASFDRASALWLAHPDAATLLAALRHATSPSDPRVTPMLAAAAAIDRAHPGYAALRFERARLLARVTNARGRRVAYTEAEALRASLVAADGRSTYNRVRALTAALAPTADDWARIAAAVPAGVTYDAILVSPPSPAPAPALAPDAADALRDHVPLARWAQLVESSALPRELVAELRAAAYVRALLLGNRTTAAHLAPALRTAVPTLAPPIDAIEHAVDDDHRALAVVLMLLHHPHLAPSARAWGEQPLTPAAIDTSYGDYGWCALATRPPAPPPVFLTRAERAAAATERAALSRLGSSPTYLAREATRLATRLPNEPGVPEALHLAVRLTRYGCRDAGNSAASRGAFRALHAHFENTAWARRTRVHY